MPWTPYAMGRGRAGRAIESALNILASLEPDLGLASVKWLKRDARLIREVSNPQTSIFALSNPNALHAARILEAAEFMIPLIVTEKPLCVFKHEAESLSAVKSKVAVLHVYRQMWGPQLIKKMIDQNDFGNLITIEGRYWHSSAAERAAGGESVAQNWKNDPKLSGPHDVLLDVGTHWFDMAFFLAGSEAVRGTTWFSYANAERPHRDTHVHLTTEFKSGCRALGSISKTAHGSSDHFEFTVIGTKGSASWSFAQPDEIFIGRGRSRTLMTRTDSQTGSRQPPFRGLGWLEGYIEILRQSIYHLEGRAFQCYPDLDSTLKIMNYLFTTNAPESSIVMPSNLQISRPERTV